MGACALKQPSAERPTPPSPAAATREGPHGGNCGGHCHHGLVCADGELVAGRYTCSSALEQDYALLGEVLGTGSSGSVCLAEGRADGRKYAVKRLEKKRVSPRSLRDLKSEVEVYLQLDHPHIVQLHRVVETDDAVHLVMEVMEGGELFDRLASRERYSEQEAAGAIYQVLLAVDYLHARRVAHRDLKLRNLMYARKDSDLLKLLDFGLAELWDPSAQMSRPCGSAHFVAPEVVFQSYTPQADMWSVGIIAYMLLTGGPLFSGTSREVLGQLRNGTPPDFSAKFTALSAPAQSFVRGLLQQNPLKRLTASKALEHPWIAERLASPSRCLDHLGTLGCPGDAAGATLRLRRALLLRALDRALPADGHPASGRWLSSLGTRALGEDEVAELRNILEEVLQGDGLDADLPTSGQRSDGSRETERSGSSAAPPGGRCGARDRLLREVFLRFDRGDRGLCAAAELCDGEPGKPKSALEGDGRSSCGELAALLEKLGEHEVLQNAAEGGARRGEMPRVGSDRGSDLAEVAAGECARPQGEDETLGNRAIGGPPVLLGARGRRAPKPGIRPLGSPGK